MSNVHLLLPTKAKDDVIMPNIAAGYVASDRDSTDHSSRLDVVTIQIRSGFNQCLGVLIWCYFIKNSTYHKSDAKYCRVEVSTRSSKLPPYQDKPFF